ncbi:4Fe-4S dicluster domain-containing protein [Haloimpatiens sp. FM7330]|uniref:4Fe-4S dicluster domain-containing protein n=1 Tax=Haloimpatiens sp. FM7330 TaxID=3298610 RepID=UPI00362D079A
MSATLNSFVIADPNKCIGCKACEVACFAAHNSNNNVKATVGTVSTPIIPRLYNVKLGKVTMPVQCRQCEDAPCANSCPVNAIKQIDNTIIIDEDECIGCKSCVMACPFGVISLLPQYRNGKEIIQNNLKGESTDSTKKMVKIIAYKCDLCKEQGEPACIKACPKDALTLVIPKEYKKKRNKKVAEDLLQAIKNYK